MRRTTVLGPLVAVLTVAMTLAGGRGGVADAQPRTAAHAEAAKAPVAHGSAHQLYAEGLPHGAAVQVLHNGHVVRRQHASDLGALLVRNLPAGSGYRIRVNGKTSKPVTVHTGRGKPWDPGVYKQTIPDHGYGYLTTRDGTKLAYSVSLPSHPASLGIPGSVQLPDVTAPYPTLIEYAGYGYADPDGPQNGIAVLANLMGFAVVDVNMRGTGCSGGAYDFFEPLQQLDAYDVIQTVARQPWVKYHKVGMMGISYGAISQLFAAQYNPPALAAIAPLSTIDTVATTLYPGGVLNDGFAVNWAKERIHDALPSGPGAGQDYARDQIAAGDAVCKSNQVMHSQAKNLLQKIRSNSHYVPRIVDPLDPISFVHKIHVPVFLACQFEDEQTGGHCPALVRHFTGTRKKWFTFTNGAHIDSLDPATFNRWFDFMSIFVARQSPAAGAAILRAAAPVLYQEALGVPQDDMITLPADPVQQQPTLAAATAAFEKTPRVTVAFDNGAGASPTGDRTAGNPYAGFSQGFSSLPVPGTQAQQWYLAPGGKLSSARPHGTHADQVRIAPRAAGLNSYVGNTGGGGLWGNASQWTYRWQQRPAGTSASYLTAPLTRDTTVVGAGAVYAWIRSSARDVDLQATVSEVRPDGKETFVQNGWQRASERRLAGRTGSMLKQPSTLLEPFPTLRAADARPLPRGRFVRVAIPLYYEGHVYRAGSRLRIVVSAPNGTQPIWNFVATRPMRGSTTVALGTGGRTASRLVLPVVPGVHVTSGLPACPSLRNEPCRPYVATVNRSAPLALPN